MPVRKIPKNYRNVTGMAANLKAVGAAAFESTLERDFLTTLAIRPDVDRFEVQPCTIEWFDEFQSRHRYTPDVLVFFNRRREGDNRPALCEIKYAADVRKNRLDLRPKFLAAIKYACQQNWRFRLITEVALPANFVRNARFLLPFVNRGPIEEIHMDLLDKKMQSLHRATPKILIESIFRDSLHQAELLPTLWYLIGSHQIGIDFTQALTMDSPIWRLR